MRSALAEFSTIRSASAESHAVIFSPAINVPDTFVSTTVAVPVPSAKTQPVALEDTPLICTPPVE